MRLDVKRLRKFIPLEQCIVRHLRLDVVPLWNDVVIVRVKPLDQSACDVFFITACDVEE